jgi:hypothetical protein
MAPVTEIAYITLKPGVELTGTTSSAQAWTETIRTIQAQEGYQRLHWGVSLEDETLLMLLIGSPPPFIFPPLLTLPKPISTKVIYILIQ